MFDSFYVRLPRWFEPDMPLLADALADGAWTAAWQPVAAYAPLAALLLGLLPPLFGKSIPNVYADSLIFALFAVAGTILSGTVGVTLLVGYAFGACVITLFRFNPWSFAEMLTQGARLLVCVTALAIPTLLVPRVARSFLPPMPQRIASWPGTKLALRAALYAGSCAVLVFAWRQGLPTMLRPLVTLNPQSADAQAVSPVSWQWLPIVLAAAVAAAARVVLEDLSSGSARADVVADLKARRWIGHRRAGLLRRVPPPVRKGFSWAIAIVLFGGLCGSWLDFAVIAALVGSVFAFRGGLLGTLPPGWTAAISKLPILLRFCIALGAGYLLGYVILSLSWSSATLRSALASSLISLVLFTLLFPDGVQLPASASSEPNAAAVARALGVAITAFLFGSVAAHAQGFYRKGGIGFPRHSGTVDNPACTGLQDCYGGPGTAGATSSSIGAMVSVATPGILPQPSTAHARTHDAHSKSAETQMRELVHCIDHALHQSTSSSAGGVCTLQGSAQDAWFTFSKFAQSGTIRHHPNPAVRDAGGYIAELPGGGVIGFRPFSKAGPAAIDVHGISGFEWLRKFKFFR
jgi:hypothetical protein